MSTKKSTATNLPQVKIQSDPTLMQGDYSNAVKVSSTNEEVIVDFAFVFPADETSMEGVMTNRIVLSSATAKILSDKLHEVLSTNVKK
jgi:hypothetical protein